MTNILGYCGLCRQMGLKVSHNGVLEPQPMALLLVMAVLQLHSYTRAPRGSHRLGVVKGQELGAQRTQPSVGAQLVGTS